MEKTEKTNFRRNEIGILGKIDFMREYCCNNNMPEELFEGSDAYHFSIIPDDSMHEVLGKDLVFIVASDNMENDRYLCANCRKITERPIIVIGKPQEDYLIEMLQAGADDYLKAPITSNLLKTLIYIHIRRDNRENK